MQSVQTLQSMQSSPSGGLYFVTHRFSLLNIFSILHQTTTKAARVYSKKR